MPRITSTHQEHSSYMNEKGGLIKWIPDDLDEANDVQKNMKRETSKKLNKQEKEMIRRLINMSNLQETI